MKLKPILAAAILFVAASTAQATTFSIGTLPYAPSIYSNVVSVPAGSFNDRYDFVFPMLGDRASASAVSIQLTSLLDIGDLSVSLFDSSNVFVAGGAAGTSSAVNNVPLTGGASYYYTVSGTATGLLGGAYAFIASASPVPEPGTYATLLAGLLAIGLMAWNRRTQP